MPNHHVVNGEYRVEVHDSLSEISAEQWNVLQPAHLLTRHTFLAAFERSNCVGKRTGWLPHHLTLWHGDRLVAAAPLYLKFHSYGEYVFDWAWADAYERSGVQYYPKLLCAIPFTPITCPKLLAADGPARSALVEALGTLARSSETSSLHCLFLTEEDAAALNERVPLKRAGVQYHWRNRGYANFDDYLEDFSRDKRKKIKQERRKVREAGVQCRWLLESECSEQDWAFFSTCYRQTYREHHSSPYLNLDFFKDIGAGFAEQVLLVAAMVDSRPVASALFWFDSQRLYGRYWGSTVQIPHLHFELCYYQAIEFCIAKGLQVFEGGAQGEHKIARGLLPVRTQSQHWLANARFAAAVQQFLRRERSNVQDYLTAWDENTPLKAPSAS